MAAGDQYFWDHRNVDAASYYVASVVGSVAEAAVDGTFTDDVTGLPNEHHAAQGRLGKTHGSFLSSTWTPFLQVRRQ